MRAAPRYPLTVFYDASCPLCAAEIGALKECDREARLELVDCSAPAFDDEGFAAEGITREGMMARLHARDAHGRWFFGPDAFEVLYAAVGLARMARVWGSPGLRPLLERLYHWAARHRQALSRLHLHRALRWLVRRLGERSCRSGSCRAA